MVRYSESRVLRALTELVVVFFGVLIALAADAWRESVVEASREREYIESLRADMLQAVQNMEQADSALGQHESTVSEFIGLITSGTPIADSLSEVRLRTAVVVVPMGTLDALVAGGAIELIDEPRLRSLILTERSEIESWLEVAGRQDLMFQQNYGEWLRRRVVVDPEIGARGFTIPASAYAGETEMLGVYINHRSIISNRQGSVRRIRASAERLLAGLPQR